MQDFIWLPKPVAANLGGAVTDAVFTSPAGELDFARVLHSQRGDIRELARHYPEYAGLHCAKVAGWTKTPLDHASPTFDVYFISLDRPGYASWRTNVSTEYLQRLLQLLPAASTAELALNYAMYKDAPILMTAWFDPLPCHFVREPVAVLKPLEEPTPRFFELPGGRALRQIPPETPYHSNDYVRYRMPDGTRVIEPRPFRAFDPPLRDVEVYRRVEHLEHTREYHYLRVGETLQPGDCWAAFRPDVAELAWALRPRGMERLPYIELLPAFTEHLTAVVRAARGVPIDFDKSIPAADGVIQRIPGNTAVCPHVDDEDLLASVNTLGFRQFDSYDALFAQILLASGARPFPYGLAPIVVTQGEPAQTAYHCVRSSAPRKEPESIVLSDPYQRAKFRQLELGVESVFSLVPKTTPSASPALQVDDQYEA